MALPPTDVSTTEFDPDRHLRDPGETLRFPCNEETSEHTLENLQAFLVGDLLGEGGMGTVSRATQVALHRSVALKRLHAGLPVGASRAMFREALITGQLEHPNVVPIHDLATDDTGRPMLVLKIIDGVEWGVALDEPRVLPPSAAADPFAFHVDVLLQVGDCLRFAHSKRIVHRDLKPNNIMIGAFGEVYVLDWGVAIRLEPDPDGLLPDRTSHPAVVGTPLYMAPEMFERGGALLSEATDVYLLGGLLHHLVTGSPPRRTSQSYSELQKQSLQPIPLPLDVPADLLSLLQQMLAVSPQQRPSVEEVQRGLRAHLKRRQADRLYASAQISLRALQEAIALNTDAGTIQRLYGASRFGLEAALQQAPSHAQAVEARYAMTEAMVEHELQHGSADTAQRLLASSTHPDPALVERVEVVLAAARAEDSRLRQLDRQYDSRNGVVLRFMLTLFYGVLIVLFPLLDGLIGLQRGLMWELTRSGLLIGWVFVAVAVLFPWLRRSAITRGYLGLALTSPLIRMIAAAMLLSSTDTHTFLVVTALLDVALMAFGCFSLDRRLFPVALTYLVSVIIAGRLGPLYSEQVLISGTALLVLQVLAMMGWTALRKPKG